MNYIKLLHTAFEKFFFNDRMNPTHISLYMALFLEWNCHRFADEFYVNRRELMKVSKIGSKTTYHRCISDLGSWNYLTYFPSNNPYKGSKIKMSIMDTSSELDTEMGRYSPLLEQLAEQYHPHTAQVVDSHRPISGQALVSYIKNTKQIKHHKIPKDSQPVCIFFKENGFSADEGKKFYTHYQTQNWKTKDGHPIIEWRALALNWMERTALFEAHQKQLQKGVSDFEDHLKTKKNKDYGQPL